MKNSTHGKWVLAVAAFLAVSMTGWTQATRPDTTWNARMSSLQAEHDAQAGVAVSIVFDDSGSMNDNHKLSMAKKAFRTWIEHAPDSYRFGLVALNAGVLVPLQRNDRAQILSAVDHLRAAGDTPLADTIAQVAAAIRQRRAQGAEYERQVVVILTDGEDNTRRGPKGVQQEIRSLCANRVEVIAFGYQGEGDYLRGGATHFYSPENEQDIGQGLNAIGSEIGDTSDVVVDEATRAAMQKLADVAPPGPTPGAPAPKAAPVPFTPYRSTLAPFSSPRPAVRQARHAGFMTWFFVALCVAVLYKAFDKYR